MKKLNSSAKTTQVDDTSDRLLILYRDEPAVAGDAFLKSLFGDMQVLSDQITESIKRDRILSEMEDADAVVEDAFRTIHAVIKGYKMMPLEAQSTAGNALYNVVKKYKLEILRYSYGNQSSNIEAFLMDIAAAELQAHIDALPGVKESIDALRTAQTDFTNRRTNYDKAIATEDGVSATELRKPLIKLINARLIPYIEAMEMANPEVYGNFAKSIERVILNTNSAIRRRKSDDEETETE